MSAPYNHDDRLYLVSTAGIHKGDRIIVGNAPMIVQAVMGEHTLRVKRPSLWHRITWRIRRWLKGE